MSGVPRSVIKVGGSVLCDHRSYASIARRLVEELDVGPTWIVVSAAAGVTDRLAQLAAGPAEEAGYRALVRSHERLNRAPLEPEILEELTGARAELDEGAPSRLLAWGERASASILRRLLERAGWTLPLVELAWDGPLGADPNAIVPGFYLRGPGGVLRLLPRGGGDISAVLAAARLGSSQARLWKAGGGLRLDDRWIPRIGSEDLVPRLPEPTRPVHVEAVRLAGRLGIELRLEEPYGRSPATTITVSGSGLVGSSARRRPGGSLNGEAPPGDGQHILAVPGGAGPPRGRFP